jgi:hypothetical protein
MKREILEGQQLPSRVIASAVAVTEKAEQELAKDCDMLVACTKTDIEAYVSMGAAPDKTVLAENGIEIMSASSSDIAYWDRYFQKMGVDKVILFVASAHPPSITGFVDVLGKGLGFLKSNECVALGGSLSDYFSAHFKVDNINIEDATFWLRAVPCGRLSEPRLSGLIARADVIILPITEGGGSNLKTAEALLADKKVVATSHALRSFEWAAQLSNVWVADTKELFTTAIRTALATDKKVRSDDEQAKVEKVTWANQLTGFSAKVKHL